MTHNDTKVNSSAIWMCPLCDNINITSSSDSELDISNQFDCLAPRKPHVLKDKSKTTPSPKSVAPLKLKLCEDGWTCVSNSKRRQKCSPAKTQGPTSGLVPLTAGPDPPLIADNISNLIFLKLKLDGTIVFTK